MTDETQNPPDRALIAAETRVRYEAVGKGHLKIYSRYVGGVLVMEAFTFQSLADVLGLPMGTLEGRYNRGKLYRWMVLIPTGESRPVRGFPLALLGEVVRVVETPGAKVIADGNDERIVDRAGRRPMSRAPIAIETVGGRRYITVHAIADHFGMSVTTVRSKLSACGLSRFAEEVRSQLQSGGRPRKVYPADMEDKIRLALENGATFHSELDAVLAKARVPEPPPFNPSNVLQFRPREAKPAKPVRDEKMDRLLDDAMGKINELMANAPPGQPVYAGAAVPVEEARHLTPQPPDPAAPDYADIRAGMLGMLKMEGYSDEAMREGEAMLRDQGVPNGVIAEIMQVAEQARASVERRAGGAA